MNQDTLVLLSGMAPKEPEQWALDEWGAKFEADYPKPWFPKLGYFWEQANRACYAASNNKDGVFWDALYRSSPDIQTVFESFDVNIIHWSRWRAECLTEFTRNEWPLLWAKKRMQAAGVAQKIHGT